MKATHTIKSINGVAEELRRLEADRATQVKSLSGREREGRSALETVRNISRQDLARTERELGEIRKEAQAQLNREGVPLPVLFDDADGGADVRQLFSRQTDLIRELSEHRRLRGEWLSSLASLSGACDDAVARLKTAGAGEIEEAIGNLRVRKGSCTAAAKEFSPAPESLDGYRAAQDRCGATIAEAEVRLGKVRRSRLKKKIAALALLFAAGLAISHYILLLNTALLVRIHPVGDIASADAGVTVFWNGKAVKSIGKVTGSDMPLRIEVRDIGGGDLTFSSSAYDEVRRHLKIFYGENDAGVIDLVRSAGTLSVSTDLPEASVEIARKGGAVVRKDVGNVPVSLPSGDYVVSVRKGLAGASREVSVRQGTRADVVVPVPRGDLNLAGVPEQSTFSLRRAGEVLISGGLLPASLHDLSAGRYSVDFKFQEESVSREVEVASGKSVAVSAVLPLGDLRITASGAKGPVTSSLSRAGKVEFSADLPASRRHLKPGEVEVSASDGTFVLRKRVMIEAARETAVEFPFAYGGAAIEATPAGAALELALDGQDPIRGATPFKSDALLPGSYEARLSFNGISKTERLTVESGKVSRLESVLPFGKIAIARGIPGATYVVYDGAGNASAPLAPESAAYIPSGEYSLEIRHGDIIGRRAIRIETSRTTEVDPLAGTGTLRVEANLPGTKFTLKPDSGPSFVAAGTAPETIQGLPYGKYALSWMPPSQPPLSAGVDLQSAEQTVSQVFKRSVRDIKDDVAFAIGQFDPVTETLPQDRKRVWDAVYAQSRGGLIKEEPYRINDYEGYLITKRSVNNTVVALFSLSDDSKWHDCAVLVTEMPSGTEVQVVTELWTLTTIPNDRLNPTSFKSSWHPDSDQPKSTELSRKFLDGVKKRLGKN